jgi:TolA-binding protein
VYPDPRVREFVTRHFTPVRVHPKETPDAFRELGDRYNAQWTPTILILDRDGTERHRLEGFLPVAEFLPQLMLGVAKAAFARKDYATAERLYREIVEQFPEAEPAAESQYWTGVSRYRATNDPSALKATAEAFSTRYQNSTWATKASVWR